MTKRGIPRWLCDLPLTLMFHVGFRAFHADKKIRWWSNCDQQLVLWGKKDMLSLSLPSPWNSMEKLLPWDPVLDADLRLKMGRVLFQGHQTPSECSHHCGGWWSWLSSLQWPWDALQPSHLGWLGGSRASTHLVSGFRGRESVCLSPRSPLHSWLASHHHPSFKLELPSYLAANLSLPRIFPHSKSKEASLGILHKDTHGPH